MHQLARSVFAVGATVLFAAAAASAQGAFQFKKIHVNNAAETNAYGINNDVTIVGSSATSAEDAKDVEWGFVRSKGGGTERPIRPSHAADSDLNGINQEGDMVGTYALKDSFGVRIGDVCFLRDDGHYQTFIVTLPNAMGALTFPDCNGINKHGDTVGSIYDAGFNNNHGWIRSRAGVVTQLDYPGAINTEATGIDDAGDVVGFYEDASFNDHGFMYSNGIYTTIDYPGGVGTNLFGINNKHEIVGSYTTSCAVAGTAKALCAGFTDHGFLRKSDGTTFLTIDVTLPNMETNSARGINDCGWIVGIYTDANGHNQGFLTREP
jgi:probable HAF family extracellular repeat protein